MFMPMPMIYSTAIYLERIEVTYYSVEIVVALFVIYDYQNNR